MGGRHLKYILGTMADFKETVKTTLVWTESLTKSPTSGTLITEICNFTYSTECETV
jgi:hypothetical protein